MAPLDPRVLEARIELRLAELQLLAAATACAVANRTLGVAPLGGAPPTGRCPMQRPGGRRGPLVR